MEFRILGPLEVRGDHGAIALRAKERAVLAVLLLRANEPVSPEHLAVALWGDEAPAGSVRTVHVHLSRLRKALGGSEILVTTPGGYRLNLQPGELDATRFEQLVSEGRLALSGGDPERAAAVLREALGLWRGPPLADLAWEPFAPTEIERLNEQHIAALEARVEADLASGRHAELIAELRGLVAEHPTRERLTGHLMVSLYRSGRQAEALDAYRQARLRLASDLGIEPGTELHRLHEAVLRHAPSLELESVEELPHQLDPATAPPLVGRAGALELLRKWWDQALSGARPLLVIEGPPGIGKTRLAAELAASVHRQGTSVRFASGRAPAGAVHDVLDRTRSARRPLLLVVDDADQAGDDVLASVRDFAGDTALVLATATDASALATLEPHGILSLRALDLPAVREIAALYAPDRAGDLPVERLFQMSGGVPRRVHDVARQWARRRAAGRVEVAAGSAAAGRAELRSMEDELAGSVMALQSAPEWREPLDDEREQVVCPFKGLAPFEAADAPYFFGRERLVAELVARLVGAPILGVVGPSGSGKSSALQAGLLPALASGVLPGSQDWPQRLIRPGENPLRQLEELLGHAPAGRFVLAVDQFEETFTACRDEAERAGFVSELMRSRAVVVVALRADFYGRCATYPELSRPLAANHVLVGRMHRAELQRAVARPAQRAGLVIDYDLVATLVAEVEAAPGALPLLSTALLELWQHRDGRHLRRESYEHTGGVRGAVARLAEEAYSRLDATERSFARRVLLHLVDVGEDQAVERRRVPLAELGGGDVSRMLEVLAERRLVTISEGSVELAHEALLREWPRLREWIRDDIDDLRIARGLRAGAREWVRVERDEGALFRGVRLAEAGEWSERSAASLPDLERDFLQASLDRERRDRTARRRRSLIAFGALALVLVAIAAVALEAIDQARDVERQRDIAASRQLGLQSSDIVADDPELALRLALTALDAAETDEAASALRDATLAFPQLAALRADATMTSAAQYLPATALTAAYSPDGSRILTGGPEGRVTLWEAASGRRVRVLQTQGSLASADFTRDGGTIVLGFAHGSVEVTDEELRRRRVIVGTGHAVTGIALSGDGRRLVAVTDVGTARMLSVARDAPPTTLDASDVAAVAMPEDGSSVATAGWDSTVRVWRLGDGGSRLLYRGSEPQADVAMTPDGDRVLAVDEGGVARVWDVAGGVEMARLEAEGALVTAAVSRDGRRFAAGGVNGQIWVWSAAGEPPTRLHHGSRVAGLDFDRSGDHLVSAGDDGIVRIWELPRYRALALPDDTTMELSADGDRVVTSDWRGKTTVWSTATGRVIASHKGPEAAIATASFSPDGDTLALAVHGGRRVQGVRLWPIGDAAGSARVTRTAVVTTVRFDAGGDRIVYAGFDGRTIVHDLRSRTEQVLVGAPTSPTDAQFSPDGRRVAAIGETGGVAVWHVDAEPALPERILEGHRGVVRALDWARDGRIATGGTDQTVRVWDPDSGDAVLIQGHEDEVTGVAFSRDGNRVLSTSRDGTLRVWDSRTGVRLATLLEGDDELHDVEVGRNGTIAVLGPLNIVRAFRCQVCGSLAQVRARALEQHPRELNAEERLRFLSETAAHTPASGP